jgi:hypothetical protein
LKGKKFNFYSNNEVNIMISDGRLWIADANGGSGGGGGTTYDINPPQGTLYDSSGWGNQYGGGSFGSSHGGGYSFGGGLGYGNDSGYGRGNNLGGRSSFGGGSTDINLPSGILYGNSEHRSEFSLTEALVKNAETTIGIIDDGKKVAEKYGGYEVAKNMPKGLESFVENADKGLKAYNEAKDALKYYDAIEQGDYRTAFSVSVNNLVGWGLSALPFAGPLFGFAAWSVMEHYDVGGWLYDKGESLDIGVKIYDWTHNDNP